MPGNSESWSNSSKLFVGIGSIMAILTALLVVAMLREPGGEPREDSFLDPTETSPAPGSPSPASKPSSGPTEVPPPGSLETVDVREVSVAPPVALDQTGDFETGVTLRITDVEAVDGEGRGPGQVSGPGLRLVLEAHNDSEDPVSLEGMVVALAYGAAETPAMSLTEPGGDPFEGELPPESKSGGVYVFAVPVQSRGQVTVSASYTGSAPTVLFKGDAARASR
jgi:hypothetical protein